MDTTTTRVLLLRHSGAGSARVCRVLNRLGFDVVRVASSDAAQRPREQPFDLALCDMDEPDSLSTADLGHLVSQHSIKAIAMSTQSRARDRASSLQAGFRAHLSKPTTSATLIATIQRVLAGDGPPAEPPPPSPPLTLSIREFDSSEELAATS